MATKYPNYSVYILQGGVLKHYSGSKRTKIDGLEMAKHVAAKAFNNYRGAYDVLILKYTAPYETTTVHLITQDRKKI